jgi:hypothetical protein
MQDMRSVRRWLIVLALLLLAFFLLAPSHSPVLTAQTVTVTPTFQASFSNYDNLLPGSEFRALGVQLGMGPSGGWWEPHLWIQRYRAETYQMGVNPVTDEYAVEGWLVSLGPAIQFMDTEHWRGGVLPEVAFGAPGRERLGTGLGVHMGFKGGLFQPQFFGRTMNHGAGWFWTLGVGMTMEVEWDPGWSNGGEWW